MPIDGTQGVIGTRDFTPPPGVRVETAEQRDLYRAALEFERFFVKEMMEGMQKSASSVGGDEESADASNGTYKDMANDQLVQSILDSGGLGFASMMYQQMGEGLGILDDAGGTS